MRTQHDKIMEYLTNHGSITPMEAYERLGITKVATRISEMKHDGKFARAEEDGYTFSQSMIDTVNRYGEKRRVMQYRLTKAEEAHA